MFIRYGMHQISFWFFQRGITPEREITQTRKKKHVSAIFPWEIHIWNFKTLACTFLDEWMNGRMDGEPETGMPHQLFRSWGHYNWQKWYKVLKFVWSYPFYQILILPVATGNFIFVLGKQEVFHCKNDFGVKIPVVNQNLWKDWTSMQYVTNKKQREKKHHRQ